MSKRFVTKNDPTLGQCVLDGAGVRLSNDGACLYMKKWKSYNEIRVNRHNVGNLRKLLHMYLNTEPKRRRGDPHIGPFPVSVDNKGNKTMSFPSLPYSGRDGMTDWLFISWRTAVSLLQRIDEVF